MQLILVAERQQESQKQAAYAEYVQLIEENQSRVPRYKVAPLSYEEWSNYLPADVTDYALAGQIATHAALTSKVSKEEAAEAEAERTTAREAVSAGKRDPGWKIPESAKTLRLPKDKLHDFIRRESELFCDRNPEFFPSKRNHEAIAAYVIDQGVNIPDESCFKAAWLRLRALGLIEDRPVVVEPAPTPLEETEASPGLTEGYDPETGEPRTFTQREIWNMDSGTFKKAFRMWTLPDGSDNRARFKRSAYQ